MNNPLLKKIAALICDVMGIDESSGLVLIGRRNFEQKDAKTGYIVVDQLGTSERESGSEQYDGDAEVMTYSAIYKTSVTIEFYGDAAHDNARELAGRLRSQAAFEKKYALGIGVNQVSSISDVAQLTGQQYGNRLQMTVVAHDCRTVDVETKRIDVAQFRILTEDEEITI
jgi:hypothetical protein